MTLSGGILLEIVHLEQQGFFGTGRSPYHCDISRTPVLQELWCIDLQEANIAKQRFSEYHIITHQILKDKGDRMETMLLTAPAPFRRHCLMIQQWEKLQLNLQLRLAERILHCVA